MTSETTKVAVVPCGSYDADILGAMRTMLDALGGIGAFIQPGQSVLVKPNLITDADPAEAKTTHPAVVSALIRILKDHGARPFVADSPASVLKLEKVWDRTGMRAICDELEVPLVNLEEGGSEQIREQGFSFTIAKRVLEADAVITVPKVKTHVLTSFTGAVKNLYGCVPGLQKTGLHKRYFKMRQFGKLLALIYGRVRPVLAVADGIVGMEGNGPTSGDPVSLGFLAASGDSIALDAALCRLLGIRTEAVPYFKPLQQAGLGETRADHIEINHVAGSIAPRQVKPPSTLSARLVPTWVVDVIRPLLWIRPSFSDQCVSCGLCVRTCPAQALSIERGGRPVLDRKRCIECCCCHEVCPEQAIDMQLSMLFRMAQKRQQAIRN